MRTVTLALGLLLIGCKQEQRDLVVRQDNGVPVFHGESEDCITRLTVAKVAEGAGPEPVWSVEHPMPMTNDSSCRMRFPVVYGRAPEGTGAWPAQAPMLEPAASYEVHAEGMTFVHGGEFVAD